MFFDLAPAALLYVILAGLILHAAWTDWREMKILNATVICILCTAVVKYLVMPDQFQWLDLAVAFGVFAAGVVFLHMLMKFGPGDVKLLGALALWFGADYSFELVALSGVLGALVAIFHSVLTSERASNFDLWGVVPRLLPYLAATGGDKKSFPYGLGIAPAALIVLAWEANLLKVF